MFVFGSAYNWLLLTHVTDIEYLMCTKGGNTCFVSEVSSNGRFGQNSWWWPSDSQEASSSCMCSVRFMFSCGAG